MNQKLNQKVQKAVFKLRVQKAESLDELLKIHAFMLRLEKELVKISDGYDRLKARLAIHKEFSDSLPKHLNKIIGKNETRIYFCSGCKKEFAMPIYVFDALKECSACKLILGEK